MVATGCHLAAAATILRQGRDELTSGNWIRRLTAIVRRCIAAVLHRSPVTPPPRQHTSCAPFQQGSPRAEGPAQAAIRRLREAAVTIRSTHHSFVRWLGTFAALCTLACQGADAAELRSTSYVVQITEDCPEGEMGCRHVS